METREACIVSFSRFLLPLSQVRLISIASQTELCWKEKANKVTITHWIAPSSEGGESAEIKVLTCMPDPKFGTQVENARVAALLDVQ